MKHLLILIFMLGLCHAQYYQGFDGDINDVPEQTVLIDTDSQHSYAWVTGITGYIAGPGFVDTCVLWFKRRSRGGNQTEIAVWTGMTRSSASRAFMSLDTDTSWMRMFVIVPPGGNYYMYLGRHTEIDSLACDGTPSRVLYVRSDGVSVFLPPGAVDTIVTERYFTMDGREIKHVIPGQVIYHFRQWKSGRTESRTIYVME